MRWRGKGETSDSWFWREEETKWFFILQESDSTGSQVLPRSQITSASGTASITLALPIFSWRIRVYYNETKAISF